jgi:hypothetical protein
MRRSALMRSALGVGVLMVAMKGSCGRYAVFGSYLTHVF